MRIFPTRSVLATGLLVAACTSSSDSIENQIRDEGGGDLAQIDYGDEDCVKIEGAQIGADVQLEVAGVSVDVGGWLGKDGERGEFRGFAYSTAGGDVVFRVKAGGELYYGSTSPWQNPNGEGGSEVKGISNIVFCPPDDDDGSPDAGTGTPCNDPDGCDAGTGGGDPIP